MANATSPFMDMYQTQLEASRRFADAIFTGREKFDHMMRQAAHHAFTEQLHLAQTVAAVRDPGGAANLQNAFFSRRPENTADYQKEIMHIFSYMQNEIGKSMRYYVEEMMSNSASKGQAALKMVQTPSARPAPNNPITGLFSVWESAFREVASLANRNMEVARAGFENVTEAVSSLNRTREAAMEKASWHSNGQKMPMADEAQHMTRANGASRAVSSAASRNVHARKSAVDRKSHAGGGKRK